MKHNTIASHASSSKRPSTPGFTTRVTARTMTLYEDMGSQSKTFQRLLIFPLFRPPSSQLLVLLAVAAGLSTGAVSLKIHRVGLSKVAGFQDEDSEHHVGWKEELPRYPPFQALPLTLEAPKTDSHHHDSAGPLYTQHPNLHPSQHPQQEGDALPQQPQLSTATLLEASKQSTLKHLIVCPTEIGVKVSQTPYHLSDVLFSIRRNKKSR